MLNLKTIRLEKQLLQKDVARALNCTASCISSWEKGITEPNINDLIRLANFFECSIDYLIGREDEDGIISMPSELHPDEQDLLDGYNSLNLSGKAKVRGYIEGLKSAPEMTKSNKSTNFTA